MLQFISRFLARGALIAAAMTVPCAVLADPAALSRALAEMRAGDWGNAAAEAAQAGIAETALIEWHRLRAGKGSFGDYRAFLADHGDFPGVRLLRRKGEASIGEDAEPEQILAYFAPEPPQTGAGAVRLVTALDKLGRDDQARAEAVRAWRTLALDEDSEAALMSSHYRTLAAHHDARLDMLVWDGLGVAAERHYSRVGKDRRALAEARLALQREDRRVDALVEAVPKALQDDAGLAYDRFAWRIEKGRGEEAVALLLERSSSAASLGRPEAWASWRRVYARRFMRAGDGAMAYGLASNHHLTEGGSFADLEWLAGYVALRLLDDPVRAIGHFEALRDAVDTPISRGRAGYWLGRAHEAAGNAEQAQIAFRAGAEHQTSFYGLLAAERVGIPMDPVLTGREVFPDWRTARFTTNPVFQVGILLLASGEYNLAERFLRHLAESRDPVELGQLGAMAQELGRPHLAVMLGKQAARQGLVYPGAYYALHPMAKEDMPVPTELALAIARRESEFDPGVVSGVGARGLMQLMPGTAREMATKVGARFDAGKLLTDPEYNAQLGIAYLDTLIAEFGASPVLVSVAYNAGPSRARRWMADRGDPRLGEIDVVDWIEHIPFRETRNYVMRVLESMPVYRARLSGQVGPIEMQGLLVGAMPVPRPVRPKLRPARPAARATE